MIQRYALLSHFLKYREVGLGGIGLSRSGFRLNADYLRLGLSGLLVLIVFVSGGSRFVTHPSQIVCSECEAVKSHYHKAPDELDFIIAQPLKP